MNYTTKKLPKSELEITVTIKVSDYEHDLEHAAEHISEKINVKGFRKGNIPFDIVKKEVGEMTLLQEAADHIIQKTFVDIIKKESLETLGHPQISIEKMAPNNDFVYKAIVAILPKIKLADPKSIKIKKEEKEITDKMVEETIDNLRKMQAKEVKKDGVATKEDKLVVDMDMFLDKVPVEGGQSKNYQVYLSEPHYIPGFEEQLVGLKAEETKEFSLKFPKDHYQKMLAGKNVDFKIKVNEVFERQIPELNEDFVKTLGQKSVEELKDLIKKNLENEEKRRAEQAVEAEMLDKMIEKTKFDEIPEVLVDSERQKMFYELQKDLDRHGITIEQYLGDIKKTEKELFEDFKAQAEKRAKAALISREIGKEQGIEATKEEVDKELEMMKQMYGNHPEYKQNLENPEVRHSLSNFIQNKKVMDWLKTQIIK